MIYRTTTGIVSAVMIFSSINFNDHFPFSNGPEGAFVYLGLPRYFKIELTIAKILGVLALLIPNVPFKIKEFAYFGFGITFRGFLNLASPIVEADCGGTWETVLR